MSEIAKTIGQRVRNYRIDKGLSQEKLAELSGCHPTYIGQVERGEKNATLESIEKIASAMNISLAQLFEKIGESSTDSYPMKCYELVAAKSKSEQEHLYKMLVATVYKGNIIKNLIMDCQSYTKYRPNETTGGIFVSWRRKEELPTGA